MSSALVELDYIQSGIQRDDFSNRNTEKAIDEEIEKQFDSMASLRRRRNSLQPISRLPTDLLICIFRLLTDGLGCNYHQKWTNVTYVCSRWRSIALDCSSLWSNIHSFESKTQVELSLKRSKKSPLAISYDIMSDGARNFENFMLALDPAECLPRIRSLKVFGTRRSSSVSRTMFKLIEFTLSFSTPILENLSFGLPTGMQHALVLPPTTLSNIMPSLKRLSLERVRISWNTVRFEGLTSLQVKGIHQEDRPTIVELLSMLRQNQRLEELELERIGPIKDDAERFEESFVELPSLRSLKLSYISLFDCQRLLPRLGIRENAEWNVKCSSDTAANLKIPIPHFLAQGVHCESLSVTIEQHFILFKVATRTDNNCLSHSEYQINVNTIGLSFFDSLPDERTTAQIFSSISMAIESCFWSDTETFILHNKVVAMFIEQVSWKKLLGCFTRLKKLNCEFASFFYRAITEQNLMVVLTPKSTGPPDALSHVCPHLSSLELSNANFANERGTFKKQFIDFLIFKKHHTKVPITHIKLTTGNALFPDTVNEIRALVEDVDWDGIEDEYKSEHNSEEGEIEYDFDEDYNDYDDEDGDYDEAWPGWYVTATLPPL